MSRPFIQLLTIVVVTVVTTLTGPAQGDHTAITFDFTRQWGGHGGTGVFGWQFSPASNIQVTRIGLYDYPNFPGAGFIGDGFAEPHAVGIWDVSAPSTLLFSTTIPSGGTAPLVSGFRYVNVSPLELNGGRLYVIGALHEYIPDIQADGVVGEFNNPAFAVTLGTDLTFLGRRSIASDSGALVFPDSYEPGALSDFGPNFTYTVVPEPAALSLIMAGGMIFSAFTKARRRGRGLFYEGLF